MIILLQPLILCILKNCFPPPALILFRFCSFYFQKWLSSSTPDSISHPKTFIDFAQVIYMKTTAQSSLTHLFTCQRVPNQPCLQNCILSHWIDSNALWWIPSGHTILMAAQLSRSPCFNGSLLPISRKNKGWQYCQKAWGEPAERLSCLWASFILNYWGRGERERINKECRYDLQKLQRNL